MPCDGTPTTSTSALVTASSRSHVARRSLCSARLLQVARVRVLLVDLGGRCRRCAPTAASACCAAASEATVVPHDPPPRTDTRTGRRHCLARRPVRERLDEHVADVRDVLGHRLGRPLGRVDRRQHDDLDGAAAQELGAPPHHLAGVADDDRHHRHARLHGDVERALLERCPAAASACACPPARSPASSARRASSRPPARAPRAPCRDRSGRRRRRPRAGTTGRRRAPAWPPSWQRR